MITSAKKSIVIALGILQIFIGIGAVELLLGWQMNPNGIRNMIGTDRD